MEQETIFDDFGTQLLRRRELLSGLTKIYAWAITGLGLYMLILGIYMLIQHFRREEASYQFWVLAIWGAQIVSSCLFLLMGVPVLLEWKYAIRINMIFAIILTILTIINLVMAQGPLGQLLLIAIFTPYWYRLHFIRYTWEHEAVGRNTK